MSISRKDRLIELLEKENADLKARLEKLEGRESTSKRVTLDSNKGNPSTARHCEERSDAAVIPPLKHSCPEGVNPGSDPGKANT